ncbi:iron ABC transporter permease [Aeromicrobium halocynthiae]|uniref:Iron ABC transporter permease n=1 Tax=Aeromicrobium halocynthiae TaxID=560557 RepID=A0ABN2W4Y1_9ACTN
MTTELAPSRTSSAPAAHSPLRDRRVLRARVLTLCSTLALVVVVLISASTGTVNLTPIDAGRLVLGHLVPGLPWMSDGSYTPLQDQVVWQFRLPRTLLAALAGAALSLAGVLLQAVVRNPLAEPAILGVSAGASVGAVSVVAIGALGAVSVSAAAFTGATVAIVAVFLAAQKNGRIAPQRLILAGVALGTFFSAVTSYLTLTTDAQNVFSVLFFLLGSVSAATMQSLVGPSCALVVAAVVVACTVRGINALSAGDEAATALGVPVNGLRALLLLTAALLTAAVVSVAGGIGFVGLVVPHVARLLVGADHRRLVPLALVGGALFLSTADLLARTVSAPAEVPLGIVTAMIGAPFFLWLMRGQAADAQGIGR